MNIVKRVSPGSAFKVGLVIYGFIGVIMGIFMAIAGMLSTLFPGPNGTSPNSLLVVGLAVGAPVLYAVFGGAMAAIGAFIYNVAARWVGGLQVEMN